MYINDKEMCIDWWLNESKTGPCDFSIYKNENNPSICLFRMITKYVSLYQRKKEKVDF